MRSSNPLVPKQSVPRVSIQRRGKTLLNAALRRQKSALTARGFFVAHPDLENVTHFVMEHLTERLPTPQTAELPDHEREPLVDVCVLLALRRARLAAGEGADDRKIRNAYLEGLTRLFFELKFYRVTARNGRVWDPIAQGLTHWESLNGAGRVERLFEPVSARNVPVAAMRIAILRAAVPPEVFALLSATVDLADAFPEAA